MIWSLILLKFWIFPFKIFFYLIKMFPSNNYLKCYSNFVLNGFSNIIIYYFQILNNRFKNLIFFTIILDYSYSRLIDYPTYFFILPYFILFFKEHFWILRLTNIILKNNEKQGYKPSTEVVTFTGHLP